MDAVKLLIYIQEYCWYAQFMDPIYKEL